MGQIQVADLIFELPFDILGRGLFLMQAIVKIKNRYSVISGMCHVGRSDESEQNVESARIDLVAASKEKQVLEKLKEKKLNEFNKQKRQKEIVAESEIALRMNQRGQST